MKTFFESLCPEAQEDLIRHGIIELVTVGADAEPDPERPDDRLTLAFSVEVTDDFQHGIPWIDTELDRIRAICGPAGEDLSVAVQDHLLVTLNTRRKELEEMREGKVGGKTVTYFSDPQLMEIIGPAIRTATPSVTVWCHCWTVAMEDDGKLIVNCEEPLYFEGLDRESLPRVRERIRRVDAAIGKIVERLTKEDGG